MRPPTVYAFIASCLLAIVLSASVAGQDDKKLNADPNTRSLEGVVTDASGAPINSATVQLKDLKSLSIRSYITHEDGKYHFAGLSTNVDYEVRAQNEHGQSSPTKRLSVYDTKKTAVIDLKVK